MGRRVDRESRVENDRELLRDDPLPSRPAPSLTLCHPFQINRWILNQMPDLKSGDEAPPGLDVHHALTYADGRGGDKAVRIEDGESESEEEESDGNEVENPDEDENEGGGEDQEDDDMVEDEDVDGQAAGSSK